MASCRLDYTTEAFVASYRWDPSLIKGSDYYLAENALPCSTIEALPLDIHCDVMTVGFLD